MPGDTILTTCPRDCYDACGILVTLRDDGSIRNVRGDPAHPISRGKLCRKCAIGYNGAFLDPEARLTTPLIRTGPKGAGEFREAGWDEAIALIAERLAAVPGETVLNAHYTGTCSLVAGGFPNRFFARLGATEVDPDSVCNKAGHVALGYVWGSSDTGFDPRTAGDASCIVVWGANPSASGPHQHEHWLAEAPGTLIVVDPIRTDTAAAADIHLQLVPGSDAALAFALMHVIERDGLADEAFLAAHAVGWEELQVELAACTPEWGERVTGVPAGLIERAARLYGDGPSLLWIGQGLQRQPTGGNVVRTVSVLPAVTGNVARPGSGFLYLNDHLVLEGELLDPTELGGGPPEPVSHMDLAERLEDRERSRALVCWNINIAASNPQQRRLRRAMERDDLFTVVVDIFPTDTADLADVVLPAASFLEFDDIVGSYFDLTISAQVKAVEPPGRALPNQEIFRRLARAMGFDEPELHVSDREIIDEVVRQSGVAESFEELASTGTRPLFAEPVMQFAGLELETPSGRVEIAAAAAAADGHPRLPQPIADPRPPDGRLRLLSPASGWTLNDTFANDPRVDRRLGAATVTLHPLDAAERGLAEGDTCVLESGEGSLELSVVVGEIAPRGVALSPKGRWPKREPGSANVNVLNPGVKADMGASSSVHGVEVTVRPVR